MPKEAMTRLGALGGQSVRKKHQLIKRNVAWCPLKNDTQIWCKCICQSVKWQIFFIVQCFPGNSDERSTTGKDQTSFKTWKM